MPSLKQIGTICFVFSLILISTKSYSDIAANNSNPSCDNSTLNTYTGPAALEAKWNANTIQLKWYKDDEQLTVQTAANQCTYDGTMTLPSTRPTKTGYDFNGWKVKTGGSSSSGGGSVGDLMCGLTVEMLDDAEFSNFLGKGYDTEENASYCNDSHGETDCSSSPFNSMATHSWKVESSIGTFEGVASCNSTGLGDIDLDDVLNELDEQVNSGVITEEEEWYMAYSEIKRPASTFNSGVSGQYCWCKATGYTSSAGGSQCSMAAAPWMYITGDMQSRFSCDTMCATLCAYRLTIDTEWAVWGLLRN